MSWVLTILGIVALIVLHELGHFTAAKAVGMRVERFSLFFPPTLLRVRRGETEYAIGAIPAGGYVKITGMNPEELGEDVDPAVARRAYYNQAPWKRIVVILAGPGMNMLIALGLFWAVLAAGNLNGATTLENLNPSIATRVATTTVAAIERGEPAQAVLRRGDKIVGIDGRSASVASVQRVVGEHGCAGTLTGGCRARAPVTLTLKRGKLTLTRTVYPRYDAAAHRMLIGFVFGEAAKRFGLLAAGAAALHEMWGVTTGLVTHLGHALTSSKARGELHSVVGITEIAHEAVDAGLGYALVFLGFISMVLAVINLFPFLPLDGGHVMWSLAEKVRGKRVSLAAMYRFSSVGIVLLLFLVINGIGNDIGRLGG